MKYAPTQHSEYQREIYGAFAPPRFSTDPQLLQEQAHKKLTKEAWDYIDGSAALGSTYRFNRQAFDNYRLVPRMLRNVTARSARVEVFGKVYASPVFLAPIGVQGQAHKQGEEATARAARELGVPMILSTAATRTIEEAATANGDGERWYQLYWPKSDEVTISLLNRAKQAGYTTLVVTLDTFVLAYRSRDLDSSYLPFLFGQGTQIGFSDPVWQAKFESEPSGTLADLFGLLAKAPNPWQLLRLLLNAKTIAKSRAWLEEMNSGTYKSWEDLELLKKHWTHGPIVLKGIQSVEDARLAAKHGMDGIIVSNHGGRQVSGAVASLDALAVIAADSEVKQSGITILFDSGIRTGADIIKALALGAKAVLLGRPYVYGLALDGQRGVEAVVKGLLADLEITMGNVGIDELVPEALEGLVQISPRPSL
ncbi:hypothetical protein PYCC9005_004440 [Savitreella phatthalungensis]